MERPHRFVVVRRPIPQDPEDAAQLTLFKDRRYAYHVLVTNLTLEPWRVYRFYRPHGPQHAYEDRGAYSESYGAEVGGSGTVAAGARRCMRVRARGSLFPRASLSLMTYAVRALMSASVTSPV